MDETRTCSKCKEPKPLTKEYFKENKECAGGLGWVCRACFNQRIREYRAAPEGELSKGGQYRRDNPDKVAGWRRKYRTRNLAHVLTIKASTPCADCGHQYPAVCMDFDHTSDDKVANISALVVQGSSLAKIDAEIAKCELVCANCHRKRTAARGEWFAGRNYGVTEDMAKVILNFDMSFREL